MAGGPGAVR